MYRIPFSDPNLIILIRHRAVMLGLPDGLVLYAAFRAEMQHIAISLGAVSLASIIGLAWSTGGYSEALSNVVVADTIALVCLLVAAGLSVTVRRGP